MIELQEMMLWRTFCMFMSKSNLASKELKDASIECIEKIDKVLDMVLPDDN